MEPRTLNKLLQHIGAKLCNATTSQLATITTLQTALRATRRRLVRAHAPTRRAASKRRRSRHLRRRSAMLTRLAHMNVCASVTPYLTFADAKATRTAAHTTQAYATAWQTHWKDASFRAQLTTGMMIDARDTERMWYAAVVVDMTSAGDSVRVHFLGWTSRWDMWIERTSADLKPLFTHTTRWRSDLRIGASVEVCHRAADKALWYEGVVCDVESARVMISTRTEAGARWFARDSEELCEAGTHIKTLSTAGRALQQELIARGVSAERVRAVLQEVMRNRANAAYWRIASYHALDLALAP